MFPHQVWLKLAKLFVRRSRLKEKVNRRTDVQKDGRRTNGPEDSKRFDYVDSDKTDVFAVVKIQ